MRPAIPDDVGLLGESRALLARKAALIHAGGPAAELADVWAGLAELEQRADAAFPLSPEGCREVSERPIAR